MFFSEIMPESFFGLICPICEEFDIRVTHAAIYQPLGTFILMEYFTCLQDLSFQTLYSDISHYFAQEKKFYWNLNKEVV